MSKWEKRRTHKNLHDILATVNSCENASISKRYANIAKDYVRGLTSVLHSPLFFCSYTGIVYRSRSEAMLKATLKLLEELKNE